MLAPAMCVADVGGPAEQQHFAAPRRKGSNVAIDGRTIGKEPEKTDAYESVWVRLVSHALIWIPLALLVWVAYVTGSWIGGPWAGVASVVSTVATAGGVWAYRRYFRRHRST